MENKIEQVKNDIESFLMDSMEHQNKQIDYILYNSKTDETIIVASDVEEMIEFSPYTKDLINGMSIVPDWDFNYDEYIFKELQNDFQIGYMNANVHSGIWNTLNDLYPEEIENKDGVQEYLQYCKENNITKEYIDKETGTNTPNIDVRETEIIDSEESYIAFVLGYDMLQDKLKNSNYPECDICYESCSSLAKQFLQSKEYKNVNHSTYEMLQEWLDNNPDLVKKCIETDNSNNKTGQLEDGITIIDIGYRKEQPIALVKREIDTDLEYVVAFNYRIKDNKMDWAYGYYYSDDITKATNDFNKVLSGGNISKTFENKEQER